MHGIDYLIFGVYFLVMLAIGYYYYRLNRTQDDYYVGGRNMGAWHIGLSVVATDVGGGFSIGLGGLGFLIGISGSWMLFTGLVGAWLSAVFLIPKVSALGRAHSFLTFPQLFNHYYDHRVALFAGVISAIGYIGFTSSQLLAGAKLASATFLELDLLFALIGMGVLAVGYTVIGGLKAVIYTDTIQWIILMVGLIFIGIPLGYIAIGGYDGIQATVSPAHLSLFNISIIDFFNWSLTIVPIWFVGMTLYQRIYACRDEATAKKAWFIAGLFEYPVMAFMGVALGMFAKVGADQGMFAELGYLSSSGMDAEMGLPLLLRQVLPIGLTGLMLSAYFSAIMSTADSCLMAASGNIVTDIIGSRKQDKSDSSLKGSQWITAGVGIVAIILATTMQSVLDLMLLSYAFMVSGLFVPVLGALFWEKSHPSAALWSMFLGGTTTAGLVIANVSLPLDLDPNFFGLSVSALSFYFVSIFKYRDEHG